MKCNTFNKGTESTINENKVQCTMQKQTEYPLNICVLHINCLGVWTVVTNDPPPTTAKVVNYQFSVALYCFSVAIKPIHATDRT